MKPPTVDALADMLYHLNFPRREFHKLPESVQDGYRLDAARLLKMMGAADDARTSGDQSRS